eukprot:CAMPEP_0119110792 /NCGR_PEP_ID=MMETSP1180-20130426/32088_1 /TAXON_ID=3052 ORGANISM="Chlamydomonas cf sp, Strain CCMP681" /NCGR_SAMPLE_ID=MMETSP1180 /ASSEMBLY_ACC=CAM_ASM_000741 /LENGTH=64 /DNA_ID=CAMNT_0007097371 /DNA_START=582 /DNA_END=772 /DNA_ORIENTATION=-
MSKHLQLSSRRNPARQFTQQDASFTCPAGLLSASTCLPYQADPEVASPAWQPKESGCDSSHDSG